jgi:hypothetical protein
MEESKKLAAAQAGKRSASKILHWLDSGGRNQVQQALQEAIKQMEERNKAREIDPDFLDRRVTY